MVLMQLLLGYPVGLLVGVFIEVKLDHGFSPGLSSIHDIGVRAMMSMELRVLSKKTML